MPAARFKASAIPGLTPKRAAFVREYLVDGNATQAAIRAGYAARSANQQGARMLANDGIQAAVKAGQEQAWNSAVMGLAEAKATCSAIARGQGPQKTTRVITKDANGDVREETRIEKDNPEVQIRAIERLAKLSGWDKLDSEGVSDVFRALLDVIDAKGRDIPGAAKGGEKA